MAQQRPNRSGPVIGGGGFNRLAAGDKTYGGGRPVPNVGKTANKVGYGQRDAKAEARRAALLRRAGSI